MYYHYEYFTLFVVQTVECFYINLILNYYTESEYLNNNAYRLGLAGQGWSKLVFCCPLPNVLSLEKQIMLVGFQISHIAMGCRAHHIITTFSMSTSTESMLLSL